MTSNLYKVNDWVYCEVSPFQPYVIRKIEELTKTPCGNVEAKVTCAFRRQDIPQSVMATIEKQQPHTKNEHKNVMNNNNNNNNSNNSSDSNPNKENVNNTNNNNTVCDYEESEVSELNEQQRYNLKHRELYYSKYTDTIAATTIRAKCSVLLFNEEVERYADFINKEDAFYYHLTYDPYQKTIVNDKGEIRVGQRYQCEIPPLKVTPNGTLIEEQQTDTKETQNDKVANDRVLRSQLQKTSSNGAREVAAEIPISQQTEEQLVWCPLSTTLGAYTNYLTDREIDQFLTLAKSVGTYARALDCSSSFKQPSLALSAAVASREITLFHAMNALHENNYNIGKAALSLITPNGPVLCKDELEDWSAAEANIFEEALDKYGKEFNEIRKECLPWKSMKSIIEYYYSYKTTDRYVQQKRNKLSEQEAKLKQVYIPNHSKQNQSAIIKSIHVQLFNQYDVHLKSSCESCGLPNTSTNVWYAYNCSNLTQLIMSGNHNPAVLAAAAASQQQAAQQNGSQNGHSFNQARLCADCWIYWKKFTAFKYPNAKQERLNQMKNQLHKCSVNGCGREFKQKQLLLKHCGIAHGYFAKTNNMPGQNSPRPPAMRNRNSFYLLTTPMTQAARVCCTGTIKLKKLARKPFKLVDLGELNKEWSKETRSISELVKKSKAKTHPKRSLNKELIQVIAKNYAKILKSKKRLEMKKNKNKLTNGATNGHHVDNHNSNTEDNDYDDDEDELVIDNNDETAKGDEPEFLKYFEQKCASPCYTPAQLIYPKPSQEQMNKFYSNLMSQNRKRPHDQSVNGDSSKQNGDASTNDSSPMSKRSLVNLNNSAQHSKTTANKQANNSVKQSVRMTQKSVKPTQLNLNKQPEEFYYAVNNYLKSLRREIKMMTLRKMARKPYRVMSKYQNLYTKFAEIRSESLAKLNGKLNGVRDAANTDANKKTTSDDEIVDVETSDSNEVALNKHKMNGESKLVDDEKNDEQVNDEDDAKMDDKQSEPVVVLD